MTKIRILHEKRLNVDLAYRGYLKTDYQVQTLLENQRSIIKFQLSSMGRKKSIQKITQKFENEFGIEELESSRTRYSASQTSETVHNVLRKYAYLNFLVSSDFLKKIQKSKINFFKDTIYSELLGEYSADEILALIRPYINEVMQKLHKLQNFEIERISRYELPFMNSSRNQFKPFKLQAQETLKQLQIQEKARLVFNRKRENMEIKMALGLVFKQIEANVIQKMERGLSQKREIEALTKFSPDYKNFEFDQRGSDIMDKLIAEANGQLGLFKLPARFGQFLPKLTEMHKREVSVDMRIKQINDELSARQASVSGQIEGSGSASIPKIALEERQKLRAELSHLMQ